MASVAANKSIKSITDCLVDSEKRLHSIRAQRAAIGRAAQKIEEDALRDMKRFRHRLRTAVGQARKILEAQYLDAVDRRRKAAQASGLGKGYSAQNDS
jgi:CHAD domain-containing protein